MEFGTPISAALLALAGVAYLLVALIIARDVLRDPAVPRPVAAAWIIGLVVLPYLVAIAYAIVRGGGMAARRAERAANPPRATASEPPTIDGTPPG